MPEEVSDRDDAHARFDQMRGERVPQFVRRDRLGDLGPTGMPAHPFIDGITREALAQPALKERDIR